MKQQRQKQKQRRKKERMEIAIRDELIRRGETVRGVGKGVAALIAKQGWTQTHSKKQGKEETFQKK